MGGWMDVRAWSTRSALGRQAALLGQGINLVELTHS
jgi:hypothetical protein